MAPGGGEPPVAQAGDRRVTPVTPAVRASHLKDDLVALARLGAPVERRVTERLAPGTLEAIREATRIAWVPVELNARLADAVHAEAGEDGARAWGRLSILHALETPLLAGLVKVAVSLLGRTPVAYFKYAPLVWNAIYRECGSLSAAPDGAGGARITAGPLPSALATVGYVTALAGSFEGAFTFCEVTGTVSVEPGAFGAPVYVARWHDARERSAG